MTVKLTTLSKQSWPVPSSKVWINPDCGLKTRGIKETKESLIKLVEAAKAARETCKQKLSYVEDLLP